MKTTYYKKILTLAPSQFAVGLSEVEIKKQEIKSTSKHKLKDLLDETLVPVVISPKGIYFIIDHHHMVLACWWAGLQRVRIQVIADYSKSHYSYKRFWKVMAKRHWIHLCDQFGKGPRNPVYLPKDVRGLADDPYRSLAWFAREAGAYHKTSIPYSEFQWAQLLRKARLLHYTQGDEFESVLKVAVKICRSKKARKLPGFIGDKK